MIPFPVEDVLVDFTIPYQGDNSEILAALVSRSYISEYLAALRQDTGIDPEILDIRVVPIASLLLTREGIPDNGLILELGSKSGTMILYMNKRISLIRQLYLSGVLDKSDASLHKNNYIAKDENIEPIIEALCLNIKTPFIHLKTSATEKSIQKGFLLQARDQFIRISRSL